MATVLNLFVEAASWGLFCFFFLSFHCLSCKNEEKWRNEIKMSEKIWKRDSVKYDIRSPRAVAIKTLKENAKKKDGISARNAGTDSRHSLPECMNPILCWRKKIHHLCLREACRLSSEQVEQRTYQGVFLPCVNVCALTGFTFHGENKNSTFLPSSVWTRGLEPSEELQGPTFDTR